ncbi:hypothetical protein SSX86_022393 [Deinandra increscens subsp. villosa]|uniref:Protein kinase domain-containing protein n=1 Tax=Deinandra increscens subsp. villosa TaxID=3103831 RepID=A0AAP0CNT8_9ASTR
MTTTWVRGVCIGKGSFGTVNIAVNKPDGHPFAVKSVTQNSHPFSEALENEIRILKSLSSDYIVRYLGDDVTSDDRNVRNVRNVRNLHMEYMPGGTVADVDRNRLDDVTVRGYTRCMTSALSYIHGRGIIHCDVKGRNVLIGSDPGVAKLADFGSAVETGAPIFSGTRGSPLWMAPEVARGEYQGPESDVWSLGCTVIEMVTGMPAWQDRGMDTLFQIGYSDDLPEFPAQISDELCDFLSKCLKRRRSERWSADQLLQHPFLLSCTPSPSERKWSPRCVFDWSDSNFSDENSSETGVSNVNSNSGSNSEDAKQRISKLCSDSPANWESDGWELVRNAGERSESETISEETTTVNWPEYSTGNMTIGRSERTNREYGDANVSYHNDGQCTNNHAESTSGGWNSIDTDNNYSCCVFLLALNKSFLSNPDSCDTFIIKILFWFNVGLISEIVNGKELVLLKNVEVNQNEDDPFERLDEILGTHEEVRVANEDVIASPIENCVEVSETVNEEFHKIMNTNEIFLARFIDEYDIVDNALDDQQNDKGCV